MAVARAHSGRQERLVGRLDPDFVVEHDVEPGHDLVCHQRDPCDAARGHMIAGLGQDPGAEGDRGDVDRKRRIAARARCEIVSAAHGGYLTGVQRGDKLRGRVLVLEFCRKSTRSVGFSADHVRFEPDSRAWRGVIGADLRCLAVENGPYFLRQIALAEWLAQ